MRENVTEQWLGKKIKAMGGLWLKFTSPGHAGVPDRIIILDGVTVYVELKTARGALSEIQKAMFYQMNKHGVSIHVIYGHDGAEKFLMDIKTPAGLVLGQMPEDVYEWR